MKGNAYGWIPGSAEPSWRVKFSDPSGSSRFYMVMWQRGSGSHLVFLQFLVTDWWLAIIVNLTQLRIFSDGKNCLDQVGLWPRLWWGAGEGQLVVGGTILGRTLYYMWVKKASKERCICFSQCFWLWMSQDWLPQVPASDFPTMVTCSLEL